MIKADPILSRWGHRAVSEQRWWKSTGLPGGKARELGGLCQRALKHKNDLIGSGLLVKKIRLARELRIDLRNEISGETVQYM